MKMKLMVGRIGIWNKYVFQTVLLLVLSSVIISCSSQKTSSYKDLKLTVEELSQYNGKNGQPVFVAIEGSIYDITLCRYWKEGAHSPSNGQAYAGRDLTAVLKTTPHGAKRLKAYPVVGVLVNKK